MVCETCPKIDAPVKRAKVNCEDGKHTIEIENRRESTKVRLPLEEGKAPSTGLFLGENIFSPTNPPSLNKTLGIGSGKYAPTEFCVYSFYDVARVEGVEVSETEAKNANSIIALNKLDTFIRIKTGSLFLPFAEERFELIFSNIAQMPLNPGATSLAHDHGGTDGWLYLQQIIEHAVEHLDSRGYLSLLVFGFLGVAQRTNKFCPSLLERFSDSGFEVVHTTKYRRKIRSGGETRKSLPHILNLYPYAEFYDEKGIRTDPLDNTNNAVTFDVSVVTSRLIK